MSDHDAGAALPNAQSSLHRCPQCSGALRYEAAAQALRCRHCGYSRQVGGTASAAIVTYDLRQRLSQASAAGYGMPLRTAKCKECGALLHFGEKRTAMHCAF
jgi:DNA-directed RNA polymerase subunit M/transcription elongation factor TFIIS